MLKDELCTRQSQVFSAHSRNHNNLSFNNNYSFFFFNGDYQEYQVELVLLNQRKLADNRKHEGYTIEMKVAIPIVPNWITPRQLRRKLLPHSALICWIACKVNRQRFTWGNVRRSPERYTPSFLPR